MLIAIDYDDTYTRDPDGWRACMEFMGKRGHSFVCITGRTDPPTMGREPHIGCPVYCTAGEPKRAFAQRRGLLVHVWIDDCPEMIGGSGRSVLWGDDDEDVQ